MNAVATEPTVTTTSTDRPTAGRWRRHRGTLLAVGAVLLVLALAVLAGLNDPGRGGEIDPENAKPDGARAVAQVLGDHGVEVDVVRGQAAFLRADLDTGTTVVVTQGWALGASTYRRLTEHAADAGGTVLVAPSDGVLDRVGLRSGGVTGGRVEADCERSLYRDLVVKVPIAPSYAAPGCFGDTGGRLLVQAPSDGRTEVLGTEALLRNDTVLDADDAALALRLLGQRDRVVWYVADPADATSDDAVSLGSLLPPWLVPGLWLLGVAGIGVVLWRGRRLGPLVPEPLPVLVRAAESTESRGRLYRRTRDRDHAARALRAATRRRLAGALSLPPDRADDGSEAGAAALVLAVSRTTGRAPEELGPVLADQPVTTDSALADLGRALLQIENEVRRA